LDVAKWLLTLDGKIDIHAENDFAFRQSVCSNNLIVSEWLLKLDGKINIHAENDDVFKFAVRKGNIKVFDLLKNIC
jgi:hypothetical protein